MTSNTLIALCVATPILYLAARWLRAQLAMHRLRHIGQIWRTVEQTWDHLGRLPQGAHSQSLRTAFATLQRHRLTRLRTLAPDHDRAKAHLRRTSQYLRGSYKPATPRIPPNTKAKLASVRALRFNLNSNKAKNVLEAGLVIRADAELNQWQARLELDDLTSSALRDSLLGKRREALQSIKQAMACLPRLPQGDAQAWRLKLTAEQQRLRLGKRGYAA